MQHCWRHVRICLTRSKELAPAAEGCCGVFWVAEVKRLRALQDIDRRIADCVVLTEASDGLWHWS